MDYWKHSTLFTIDFAATLAGLLIGLPFALILSAPFLCAG